MKIYNKDKTHVLENIDLEKGYLVDDVIETYIPEIQAIPEQGHYETIANYPNGGKDVEWVIDVEGVAYQPARVDKELIKVFIPYTAEQLEEERKNTLRKKREPLLVAFDTYKTNVGYGTEIETAEQHQKMVEWYQDLKDLKETAFVSIPDRVNYYLKIKE